MIGREWCCPRQCSEWDECRGLNARIIDSHPPRHMRKRKRAQGKKKSCRVQSALFFLLIFQRAALVEGDGEKKAGQVVNPMNQLATSPSLTCKRPGREKMIKGLAALIPQSDPSLIEDGTVGQIVAILPKNTMTLLSVEPIRAKSRHYGPINQGWKTGRE